MIKGSAIKDFTKRKFTLVDASLLVAAAAFAMALVRWGQNGWTFLSTPKTFAWSIPFSILLSTTLFLIPIRLIPPRPRGNRLWRQPGWAASTAVALALIIFAVDDLLKFSMDHPKASYFEHRWQEYKAGFFRNFPLSAVTAISVTWAGLALAGARRTEKGWIDRLGRILGVGWLAYVISHWIYDLARDLL